MLERENKAAMEQDAADALTMANAANQRRLEDMQRQQDEELEEQRRQLDEHQEHLRREAELARCNDICVPGPGRNSSRFPVSQCSKARCV